MTGQVRRHASFAPAWEARAQVGRCQYYTAWQPFVPANWLVRLRFEILPAAGSACLRSVSVLPAGFCCIAVAAPAPPLPAAHRSPGPPAPSSGSCPPPTGLVDRACPAAPLASSDSSSTGAATAESVARFVGRACCGVLCPCIAWPVVFPFGINTSRATCNPPPTIHTHPTCRRCLFPSQSLSTITRLSQSTFNLPALDALIVFAACTCPHRCPSPGPPVTCSPRPQKASAVDAVALAAAAEAYQGPSLPLGDLHHPQGTGAPTYVPRRLQVQEAATQIRLAVQQANTSEVRRAALRLPRCACCAMCWAVHAAPDGRCTVGTRSH